MFKTTKPLATLLSALLLCWAVEASACTNLIVSKGCSADGSTFITYAADSQKPH